MPINIGISLEVPKFPMQGQAVVVANNFLLLEDGFYLLQEDGTSKIILEP